MINWCWRKIEEAVGGLNGHVIFWSVHPEAIRYPDGSYHMSTYLIKYPEGVRIRDYFWRPGDPFP